MLKKVSNNTNDYRVQIEHGLAYIKNRPNYGSPTTVWNFHQKKRLVLRMKILNYNGLNYLLLIKRKLIILNNLLFMIYFFN